MNRDEMRNCLTEVKRNTTGDATAVVDDKLLDEVMAYAAGKADGEVQRQHLLAAIKKYKGMLAENEKLLELFSEYQIPSDLLAFDGPHEADAAEKLAAVRASIRTRTVAVAAAENLLAPPPTGFGYGAYASEGQPAPLNRLPPLGPRNSWADALCCFALLASDACSGRENPALLLRATERDYQTTRGSLEGRTFSGGGGGSGNGSGNGSGGDSGGGSGGVGQQRRRLLAHAPIEGRAPDDDSGAANGCYSSTQAWWGLVQRAAGRAAGAAHLEETLEPFHRAAVASAAAAAAGGEGGTECLLPVGTQHPQVRLWANTEFAAALLLEYEDFCL